VKSAQADVHSQRGKPGGRGGPGGRSRPGGLGGPGGGVESSVVLEIGNHLREPVPDRIQVSPVHLLTSRAQAGPESVFLEMSKQGSEGSGGASSAMAPMGATSSSPKDNIAVKRETFMVVSCADNQVSTTVRSVVCRRHRSRRGASRRCLRCGRR